MNSRVKEPMFPYSMEILAAAVALQDTAMQCPFQCCCTSQWRKPIGLGCKLVELNQSRLDFYTTLQLLILKKKACEESKSICTLMYSTSIHSHNWLSAQRRANSKQKMPCIEIVMILIESVSKNTQITHSHHIVLSSSTEKQVLQCNPIQVYLEAPLCSMKFTFRKVL